ncbi:MAG: DUF3300 domain-containing protein [Candidatus Acidiferrales bacterium]
MMRHSPRRANGWTIFLALLVSAGLCVQPLLAQDQAPPNYSPEQLNRMVSRIALYPDPLLAQILTAATFPDQIPDAAKWADEHHYLSGQDLANAITGDQLSWDPSVQALLPFPSVLDMMASDMDWTTDLGNAVLAQRPDVMDAVQSERHKARDYGYLRSNAQIVVSGGSYIQIMPANPDFIVVPAYDPLIVFAPPRPGFFVGGAIAFGFGIGIGAWFRPWGWGGSRIVWGSHALFINNARWGRDWGNRRVYVHPYPGIHRYARGARVEHHELIRRSAPERMAARSGRRVREEHRPGRPGGRGRPH